MKTLALLFIMLSLTNPVGASQLSVCTGGLGQFAQDVVATAVLIDLAELLVDYEYRETSEASSEMARAVLVKKYGDLRELIRVEPSMMALQASGISPKEFEEILSQKVRLLIAPYTEHIRSTTGSMGLNADRKEARGRAEEAFEMAQLELEAVSGNMSKLQGEMDRLRQSKEEEIKKLDESGKPSGSSFASKVGRFFAGANSRSQNLAIQKRGELDFELRQGLAKMSGQMMSLHRIRLEKEAKFQLTQRNYLKVIQEQGGSGEKRE